jgi:hypothetical protein
VDLTYDGSVTAPTAAGSYAVVATIADANYSGTASGTLVIGKATATVTLGDLAATYNGSAKSASSTTSPEGLVVDLSYDASATAPTAAGSYAVIATVNDANYEGTASGTLVIGKATATVTLGDLVATYDGSAKSASATTSPEGLVVNLNYDGSAAAPTAAGSYVVVATIADANYSGTASGTLVIGKAFATVTLGGLAATYDGSAKSASATTSPEGLVVDLTYDGSVTAPTAAGSYAVIATVNDTNYTGTVSGTLIIGKATAIVTLGDLAATYDGSAKSASALTDPEGLVVDLTYDGSSAAPTAAGSYAVVATIADANYEGTASGTLVIGKAMATVTLGDLAATYDGSAKSASALTDPEGLAVNLTYDGSTSAPVVAGSYAVVATVSNSNYEGTASGTLIIGKATATVTLGNLAATYNGSAKSASATTVPSGLAVGLTYDGSVTAPTAAGSYAVIATVNDTNYTGTVSGTLIIGKATANVTLGNLAATYDGSAKSASATTSPEGLVVDLTYDGSSAALTVAGSYAVIATVDDANYEGSTTGTLVIGKATATVTLGDLAATYDGSAKTAAATTSPEGLVVDLTYDGSSAAPTAAGSYAVVATIADANYEGTASGTLVIGKATATVTLGDLAATYDGSAKSASATTSPEGLAVNLTYDGSTSAPVAAGSYAVVAAIDDANYEGTASGTLVIGKAAASVTLGDLAATYDGSSKTASATTSPEGLVVDLSYEGSAAAPTAAGSYPVVATINDLNYEGTASGMLVIGKATATVTLADLAATYDGSGKAASVTTDPEGLAVSLTYNESATAPIAAGNYPVVATINDLNYEGTVSGTLVVGKAVATVTLGNLAATYDGSAKAASGTTDPEDLALSLTYDESATAPTAAGSYAVTATINDANYEGTVSGTLVIGKAVATVTLGNLAATYDGSAKEASAVTDPVGLTVSWTYDGSATAPAAAGSYEVVATIVDTNYEGAASGNLVIGKALATVALGNLAATYDGAAKIATATTDPEGLTVSLTYEGSATAPTAAGSYPVVATIVNDNYEGAASGTLVIGKAAATVTLGDLAATYDGSSKTASATTSPEGLVVDLSYEGSAAAPTAAGSYAVVATIADANYEGTASGTLVIGKATATVTLGELAATYDGSGKAASVTTAPEGLTVSLTYDGSAAAPTAAGSYPVVATINDANYEGAASGMLVIGKAVATVTLGELAATYDGSAKAASGTTDPEGLALSLTYDESATAPTAAGSYAVTATINDANYEGTASGTLIIGRATATVTFSDLAATYDGAPKSASATTTPEELAVSLTYDGSVTEPTDAGSYAVIATVNDANYEGTASGTLVIGKATASVTLGDLAATYDGSAKSASATTSPEGLVVDLSYDASATAPTAAGSYAVVATIADANYEGTASGTLVIGKAAAAVTLGNLAAPYNGSAKMASATTVPSGLTVGLTYDGSATAPTAAGSYAVVATIADANYEGTASGTLVIGKATATVTLGNLAATYDGSAKTASATTAPEGLTVGLTYDASATAPTAAGSYAVTATINDLNYEGTVSGTLVVGKAVATVTLGNLAATYDGTAKIATATTDPEGLTVNLTYDGSATAPSSAGNYPVVATIADDNYEGTATGTLVIGKAVANVTLGDLAVAYDGSAKSASAVTDPVGLTVSLTYEGSAAAPTAAGSYEVVATIEDSNYEGSTSGTLVISKATATVTLGDLAVAYDGSAKSASAVTDPVGLTVSLTYEGSATAPTAAGSYEVVATIVDDNYERAASGTLVISKATATVTLGDLAIAYDGSAKSASAVTDPVGLTVSLTYDGSATAPTAAGSYPVVATINDLNYEGTASGMLVIGKATATVTLADLASTYDGSSKTATAMTSPEGLSVDLSYDASATAPTAAGSYAVIATISDLNYEGTASGTLVIGKAAATVTLGNLAATYDGTPKAASVITAPVGLAVNLTYDGSISAPVNAGPYSVVATINHSNYSGSASGTLVISKAAQVVTFGAIADQTLGAPAFALTATSTSGLSVQLAVISGPATVSGSQLTLTGLGVVVVQASQAGNANWTAATPVQRTFSVVAGDFSQGYVWAKGYGGSGYDTAYAVAANATGQAYLLGDFENSVAFGASTFSVAGGSLSDLVLMKTNIDGSIAWARQYGGVNSDLAKTAVPLPSGGVVVGGEFFTSTVISGTTLTSAGSKDIVLVKVDTDGTTQWSKRFGGTSSDSLHSMAADTEGNIYLAGQFSGSITFGTTTTLASSGSSGSSDGFVVKLDSTGTPVWSRKMGGTGADIAYSVALKSTGEITVAGSFNGGATFGSISLSSAGSSDAFATVLNSSGTFLWAKRFGGTTADNARTAAFDGAGNLWVSGSFTGSSATGFGSPNLASAGAEDAFVVRLALADGTLIETNRYGGTGSDTAISLAADPFGTMMLAGSFQNSVTFGSTTLTSSGLSDSYVAKLRAGSGVVWALRGGGANDDRSQALSVNASGEIFHAGVFDTSASFGTHAITGGGLWDFFIAKLNGPVPAFTTVFADLSVDEGDLWSLTTGTLGAEPVTFQWFKDGAPISGAASSTYSVAAVPADAGVYVLQATNAYGSSTTTPVTVTVRVPDQVLSVEPPLASSENRAIEAPVYLDSLGDVTGLSFIISYDKAYLTNSTFVLGPHLVAGNSSVVVDKNAGTVRVVGSAFPSSFPEGRRLVGTLRATTRSVPAGASVTLAPTLLSISDIFGRPIEGYTKLRGSTMAIAQRVIPGDANNNGRLDVSDAAELIRLYANPSLIRTWDHYLNDLNLDTILTEGDATRVLRVVADLDDVPDFPQAAPLFMKSMLMAASSGPLLKTNSLRMAASTSAVPVSSGSGALQLAGSPAAAARLVLSRLTGANANKVLAQVYLDDVPAGQAGVSFQVDYPASVLRVAGASSLIVPSGGLPAGVAPTWNVFPGNAYVAQTGSLTLAAAWGSSWTFTNGQAVANIVFEVNPAVIGQVHFPLTLAATEVAPYNADGPSTPLSVPGQVVVFNRTYADWALATLGNAAAGSSLDPDGDGMSNALEYAASTNPNDPNSRLQTTAATMTAGGYKLRWFAAYGVSYKVRWSADLKTWNDLTPPYTGTGAETEATDPAPPAGERFYRVEVIP